MLFCMALVRNNKYPMKWYFNKKIIFDWWVPGCQYNFPFRKCVQMYWKWCWIWFDDSCEDPQYYNITSARFEVWTNIIAIISYGKISIIQFQWHSDNCLQWTMRPKSFNSNHLHVPHIWQQLKRKCASHICDTLVAATNNVFSMQAIELWCFNWTSIELMSTLLLYPGIKIVLVVF